MLPNATLHYSNAFILDTFAGAYLPRIFFIRSTISGG
jgi:hypothetical protein